MEAKAAVESQAEEAHSAAKQEQGTRADELKAKTKEMAAEAKLLQAADRAVALVERKHADIEKAAGNAAAASASPDAPEAKLKNQLLAFLKGSSIDKTLLQAASVALTRGASSRGNFEAESLKALKEFIAAEQAAASKEIEAEVEKRKAIEQTMVPLMDARNALAAAQDKTDAQKKVLDDAVTARMQAAADLQAVVDEAEKAQSDLDANSDLVKTFEEVRESFEALKNAVPPELELAINVIDHTTLNDMDSSASVDRICKEALQKPSPAAVCIYPRFVKEVRERYPDLPIATVANFPKGTQSPQEVAAEAAQAVENGANEVDIVIDYAAVIKDEEIGYAAVKELVETVRAAVPFCVLKVILETGELKEPRLIRGSADAALDGGADFIKTSTGKVAVNCTPEAAEVMFQAIVAHRKKTGKSAGFKGAGGVRTFDQAKEYFKIARAALGAKEPLSSKNFRFGSSSLLPTLRAEAGVTSAATATAGPGMGY
jgi:deoxyribose-phosphate aldolase